ncbi:MULTISPECIES: recombinase family protein [Paraburkholderia]|uniref:recombinase family protein n=1 Tax=Paraburkholderia TaxID=1822464 RepID=UPI0038B8A951
MDKPNFPPGTKAYSYIRFSSAPQERGDSVRRQTKLSVEYASEHGLILDEALTLRDLGLSAFDGANIAKGALGAFLESARKGLIPEGAVLLVESFDRISRQDPWKAFGLFQDIVNQGITIVTLADGQVFNSERLKGQNAMGPMMLSIAVMTRAHEESARKSERGRAAWQAKRDKASIKKVTRTCPQWIRAIGDKDMFEFELIPEKADIVRRIVDLQMTGMGQQAIVKLLNQEGIPPINYRSRLGNGWHPSTIQKICTNPALYGGYQPTMTDGISRKPAGFLVENYFPALLTKDEFHALQAARADRLSRGRGAKGAEFTNIFSGLLKCGYCGESMTVAGHKPAKALRTKRFIACSNAKRGLGCHFIMWNLEDFEKTVLTYLKGIDFSDLIGTGNSLSGKITAVETQIIGLRAKRNEVHLKVQRLLDAIESGEIVVDALQERFASQQKAKDEIESEIDARERELFGLKNTLSDMATIKDSVLALDERMRQVEGDELYQLRARLALQIRRTVTRINVYPGGAYLVDREDPDPEDADSHWVGSQEGMEAEKPDRSFRRAEIIGANGGSYFTSTVNDAWAGERLGQAETGRAETLEKLGQTPDVERALRQKESCRATRKNRS